MGKSWVLTQTGFCGQIRTYVLIVWPGSMPTKAQFLVPMMRKTSKKYERCLILLFSFWFLIFPAYLNFTILDDSDMTPSYPAIGKIDQEDLILGSGEKGKILVSALSTEHIYIAHPSLVWVPNLLNQLPVLNSKSLILRC